MIEILWEFVVRKECKEEFEKQYSTSGAWTEFFRRSPAYQGVKLLAGEANRYLTVDRWDSREAYEEFRMANRQEYSDLDEKFEALTISERCLGIFEMK